MESSDPERIGRYRLIGRLGAGGMGQVFFGRSAGGRAVAVKRIHPHMAADASFRERFAREVNAARQVSGAFTAPVIDADPDDEVPWLVTSYVPSLPLDDAVQNHGPLPEPTVRVLAAGLAEALAEIHRAGLIHRDLKPGNVLLAEDGPRVIDFGIARATDGTAATQSVIGTPGFMSPEQVQGETMTPASDLFAYGAVLSYAATGGGPFGEGNMPTMVMRIISHEPDLSRLPESLRRLASACLAKDPGARPTPGQILDYVGDVPAGTAWLPPAVMSGVQEQVAQVNKALATSAGETAAHERTQQGMGRGHNRRVQDDDPIMHAETAAFRNAGRRPHYRDTIMVTTLSPCWYCSGLIRQFGIGGLVIGEAATFSGGHDWLAASGVEVTLLDDADCAAMMETFIRERPALWFEDIGTPTDGNRSAEK